MNATSALKMRSTLRADNPVTCMEALKNGDTMVKLSAVVMGLGNMAHKQVAKGLLFLAAEVAYSQGPFVPGGRGGLHRLYGDERLPQSGHAAQPGHRRAPGSLERGAANF